MLPIFKFFFLAICSICLFGSRALAEDIKTLIEKGALVIDVRTAGEYSASHVEGALNIPYDQIESRAGEVGADKERAIVLYCRSGRRSGIAKETLDRLGYRNVVNAGGYEANKEARR